MSTRNPRDPSKEQFWRRILGQWRKSGLSVRAFCQLHDLPEPRFYSWRRTLAQRDAEAVAFVPVHVLPPEQPVPVGDDAPGLELLLPGGHVLRIGPSFDGLTLERLLAVLKEGQP